jgi:lysophospholipase L1-like esterase
LQSIKNGPKTYEMKILLFALPFFFAGSLFAEKKELHSALEPVPRQGGWMKRHESFNKRVAEGKVDLVLIGDSITQGWEGRGKKVWEKHYGKRNAVNLGIGGDRTQHVIWRLDNGNLKGIAPKAAVIMIGTNNAGSNKSEEIADGVAAITKQLQTKLPKTQVLLLAIFPRGANKDDGRRKVNEKANAIFKKLADGKQVHYLDIGPKFLEKDGTLTREIMPDLLHLSEKGYTIWAESIEEKVSSMMAK